MPKCQGAIKYDDDDDDDDDAMTNRFTFCEKVDVADSVYQFKLISNYSPAA